MRHWQYLLLNFVAYMQFNRNTLLCALLAGFVLISCNTRLEQATEPSEGIPSEVLVVSDEDEMENIKTAFATHFNVFNPNLLVAENANKKQFEKTFSFWNARSESYEGSEKMAALILVFGESGKYSKDLTKTHPVASFNSKNGYSIQVFKNVWAKPQTVFRLRYGRDMNAEKILSKGGAAEINKLLLQYELEQGLPGNIAANTYTDSVTKVIDHNYGFGFHFSPQFRLAYSNTDVVWLQQETQKFYRHIFINIFSDSIPMDSMSHAIANRDLFSRKYIKNTEGTSTLVSKSSIFPIVWSKNEKVGKHKANVLRGWYQEDGTYRRGPFVRYIFHDQNNHRYIALDGFVYAPDMGRQSFYRTFEIIAQSFYLK